MTECTGDDTNEPAPDPATDQVWPYSGDFAERRTKVLTELRERERFLRDSVQRVLGAGRLGSAGGSILTFLFFPRPIFKFYYWFGSSLFAAVLKSARVFVAAGHLVFFVGFVAVYLFARLYSEIFVVWAALYSVLLVGLLTSLTFHVVVPTEKRMFGRAVSLPALLVAAWIGPTLILMTLVERRWVLLAGKGGPTFIDKSDLWGVPIWHMLDVLPFVKVPETLAWEAPLVYEQFFIGFVLLVTKLALVLGVAEMTKGVWKEFTG